MKSPTIRQIILKSILPLNQEPKNVTIELNENNIQAIINILDHIKPNLWHSKYIFFDGTEKSLNYFAIFASLSFCYWKDPRWFLKIDHEDIGGSYGLFYALKKVLDNHCDITDPKVIKNLTFNQFAAILAGADNNPIPFLKRRYDILKEIGYVLETRFKNSFLNLFIEADFDANRINELLINNFACLNDSHFFDNKQIKFFRKSQEIISLIYEAFENKSFGKITNINHLTLSSDYKLPQVLNYLGFIKYSQKLEEKIINKYEFKMKDIEALEIRSATIYTGELIINELKKRNITINAQELSNVLWTASQADGFKEKALPYPRIWSEWV